MCLKNKWQIPEIAPKDGTVFIADIGYPWPVPCAWSDSNKEWVIATLQACEIEAGMDTYFENEWQKEGELKRWQPMLGFE